MSIHVLPFLHGLHQSGSMCLELWFTNYVLAYVGPAGSNHGLPERGAFGWVTVDVATDGGWHLGSEVPGELK